MNDLSLGHMKNMYAPFVIDGDTYSIPLEGIGSRHVQLLKHNLQKNSLIGYPHFKGMIQDMNNSLVSVFDTRKHFGLKTLEEEVAVLSKSFDSGKVAHELFVENVGKNVYGKDIWVDLEGNPHKCGFGISYYKNKDHSLFKIYSALGNKMDEVEHPHNLIHFALAEIEEALLDSDRDKAIRIYERIKEGSLKDIKKLLSYLSENISALPINNQIAIIIDKYNDNKVDKFAITADMTGAIYSSKELDVTMKSPYILGLNKSSPEGSPIKVVNLDNFFS